MTIPTFIMVKKVDLVTAYLRSNGWVIREDGTILVCPPGESNYAEMGKLIACNLVPAPGAEGGDFEMHLKIEPTPKQEKENGNASGNEGGADKGGGTGTDNKGEA